MKYLCLTLLFLAVVARADEMPKTDQDLIQGEWIVVAGERDGKEMKDLNGVRWVFGPKGNLSTHRGNDKQPGAFKLAPNKKPKQIDLDPFDEPENVVGIYDLDGDVLKLCIVRPSKYSRPTDFVTKEGSGRLLLILERKKK